LSASWHKGGNKELFVLDRLELWGASAESLAECQTCTLTALQ